MRRQAAQHRAAFSGDRGAGNMAKSAEDRRAELERKIAWRESEIVTYDRSIEQYKSKIAYLATQQQNWRVQIEAMRRELAELPEPCVHPEKQPGMKLKMCECGVVKWYVPELV